MSTSSKWKDLPTEAINPASVELDKAPTEEIVELMLGEDAKVVASVQSPLYGLSGVLNGLLRGLVGALSAIEKQRVEGGENA